MNKGQYDTETLLIKYEPLIKSIFKKFHVYFNSNDDKLELYTQIQFEFIKLINEYDPRRGVDIPCFLKRMLNLRVYHYVTKCLNLKNRETNYENVYKVVEEQSEEEEYYFDKAEAIASLDKNLVLGVKQRKLMSDILIYNKTLNEIAKEENVDIKVIRLRLHFLCQKLYNHSIEKKEYYDWHNGKTPSEFIDYKD